MDEKKGTEDKADALEKADQRDEGALAETHQGDTQVSQMEAKQGSREDATRKEKDAIVIPRFWASSTHDLQLTPGEDSSVPTQVEGSTKGFSYQYIGTCTLEGSSNIARRCPLGVI